MVKAIRSISTELVLDIHLCVERPGRYVQSLAKAGADRIIFMYEALDKDEAVDIAMKVRDSGMNVGISVNPETDVNEIYGLLETGLFDTVDLLAVRPGFGGQELQDSIFEKIKTLKRWIEKNKTINLLVMVDGGVNKSTSTTLRASGADILVAGTFLFRHEKSFSEGVKELTV